MTVSPPLPIFRGLCPAFILIEAILLTNSMDPRVRTIRLASHISIGGNLLLAVMKITVGFYSGSLAVVGDGLDSLNDVVISLMALYTAVIIARPPDREHPYGHTRAETIATSVLAFAIFSIGLQLFMSTIKDILLGETFNMPEPPAVYIMIVSVVGKYILARTQFALGRKADSQMIIANARNMQNDILTSLSVLLGLGAVFVFRIPVVDKVLAALIGLWIMYTAVRIFIGIVTELMEGVRDETLYTRIFDAVKSTSGAANPHRVRVRKIGSLYVVDLDVEVDGSLTVNEAHDISRRIEAGIRASIPRIYDVLVHIEPLGNVEERERYGRSPEETD